MRVATESRCIDEVLLFTVSSSGLKKMCTPSSIVKPENYKIENCCGATEAGREQQKKAEVRERFQQNRLLLTISLMAEGLLGGSWAQKEKLNPKGRLYIHLPQC